MADESAPEWLRARTIAGFLVLLTSIAMFVASALLPNVDLSQPAWAFLALGAYALFGVSLPEILRVIGAALGGAGSALQRSTAPDGDKDD